MTYSHQPENIKICPECGTNLIHTARRCAVCGYRFTDDELKTTEEQQPKKRSLFTPVTINLPILIGMVLVVISVTSLFVLGLKKRDQTKALVAAEEATATYIATTYVSPTPPPTATFTPAPPTETPVVDIDYTVVEGDSCLSIAKHFSVDVNALLLKNDIDCSLLKIGTALKIPHPTETPIPVSTAVATTAP